MRGNIVKIYYYKCYKIVDPTDYAHIWANTPYEIINNENNNSCQFYRERNIQFEMENNPINQNYNNHIHQHNRHYNHHNQFLPNGKINFNQQISNGNNFDFFNPPKMNHLRGLVNIESTCYMNSILQCFSHISELSDYFKAPKMNQLSVKNINNKSKIYPVFQEVIINLWNTWDNSPYSPYNFKKRLGEMNPLFKGAYPNDAKDLLTFLLLKLHEELNNPKKNNINNKIININQQNKKLMFDNFIQNFINNYRSIISGLFYGLIYTKVICKFCKTKYYNYQAFNFLIFPLEKVLKYKQSLTNFTSNCNNTVTIQDCFKHYQLSSILNNYFCNNCKHQNDCSYTNKISILPNIIIIILNRGKGLQYKVNISFENENLGLKDYVEYCKDQSIYELIGLVTHYGESSASGHFMARCKSPIDGNWYLYNDQSVTKLGLFDRKTFAQGNPYILFYKKIR